MRDGAGRTAASEFRSAWPALAGAALGLASSALTIFYYTQGLFLRPLGEAFGWTRSQMSTIGLAGGFVIAAASVTTGWLVDRFGGRIPALVGYVAVTLAFLAMSASGPSFALFMTVQLAVIAFGALDGPANYTRAVNQGFERARGLALGLAFGATGLSALITPAVIAWVIQTHGWRTAYQVLALVTAVCGPLALLLLSLRKRTAPPGAASKGTGKSLSLARALADPIYLRLLVAFSLMSMGAGGLVLHLASVLTDHGVDMVGAGRAQGLLGVSILIGRLGVGYLMDRVFAPWVAVVTAVLAAIGLFALAGLGAGAAGPAAILVGLTLGAEGDVVGYVTARYFGLASYGRLYGLLYGAYTVGLGGGGFFMARLQAAFGSYGPALVAAGATLLVGAAVLAQAPRFETAKAAQA